MVSCHTLTEIDGHILRVNPAFCDVMGMMEGDLIGRHILSITHPEDRGDTQLGMRRLRDESRGFRIRKRYVRADGAIVWAEAHALVVAAPLGQKHIAGHIELVQPDLALQNRRALDFAIYEALGKLATVRKLP